MHKLEVHTINQIQLEHYTNAILNKIEPNLQDKRLADEADLFKQALTLQFKQLGRQPDEAQISAAWHRWKEERIHGVELCNQYTEQMRTQIKQDVVNHLSETENPDINIFASEYASMLQHLGKPPLTQHIESAYETWRKHKIL